MKNLHGYRSGPGVVDGRELTGLRGDRMKKALGIDCLPEVWPAQRFGKANLCAKRSGTFNFSGRIRSGNNHDYRFSDVLRSLQSEPAKKINPGEPRHV